MARNGERILGWDLIRLVSFMAIAVFHISVIHFHTNELALSDRSTFIYVVETLARSISFSGFTVLFLSSVLTGFSGSSLVKRLRLFAFLFVGWLLLCYLIRARYSMLTTWDIYLLIISGVFVASLAELIGPRAIRGLALCGFVMLWVPVWDLGDYVENSFGMPPMWQSVLGFANCSISFSEWPLLPWVGMIWFGYGAGVELKAMMVAGRERELDFNRTEAVVWLAMLGASIPQWGAFFNIGLVDFFRCDAYKQPPVVFWSHLIWPIFLMRLSLDSSVRGWLNRRRIVHWVASLAISRSFWLAYAMHYVLALFLSFLVNVTGTPQEPYYDTVVILIAIFYLPLTELCMRAFLWILAWAMRWSGVGLLRSRGPESDPSPTD